MIHKYIECDFKVLATITTEIRLAKNKMIPYTFSPVMVKVEWNDFMLHKEDRLRFGISFCGLNIIGDMVSYNEPVGNITPDTVSVGLDIDVDASKKAEQILEKYKELLPKQPVTFNPAIKFQSGRAIDLTVGVPQYKREYAHNTPSQIYAFEKFKDRFLEQGFACGSYSNNCCRCHKDFIGDKRAVQCFDCSMNVIANDILQGKKQDKNIEIVYSSANGDVKYPKIYHKMYCPYCGTHDIKVDVKSVFGNIGWIEEAYCNKCERGF